MDTHFDDKYQALDQLCRDAKAKGVDAILIDHPQVLGDDYTELVWNMNKIAEAGLSIKIVPPSQRKRH